MLTLVVKIKLSKQKVLNHLSLLPVTLARAGAMNPDSDMVNGYNAEDSTTAPALKTRAA